MFSKDNPFADYKKTLEERAKFSPKEVKMAIGIASDPRYKKGNYTGAVQAIEKIADGLSDHPQVKAVLKRQNESEQVKEDDPCWDGYKKVPGKKDFEKGSCVKESFLTEDKSAVVEEMKTLLATAYTLAVKAQNYHWNVQGPDFVQYHEFIGDYYHFLDDHIDTIAEQIRTMNAKAPGTQAEFLEKSKVMEDTTAPTAIQMLGNLGADNEILIDVAMATNQASEANGVTGLTNYLEDFIDQLYKKNWFFKSIQGTSISESVEESKVECPKCKGEGCDHCGDKGYHVNEAGYMDAPKTKKEVEDKHPDTEDDVKNKESIDLHAIKVSEAVDKKLLKQLQSLDPDEARVIVQGLPKSIRAAMMKELGIKEKVDGRTKAYKETVSRLTAKKEGMKEGYYKDQEIDMMDKLDQILAPTKNIQQGYAAVKKAMKISDKEAKALVDKHMKMVMGESTADYAAALEKIANDKKVKEITPKDRETLSKLAQMMKSANEEVDVESNLPLAEEISNDYRFISINERRGFIFAAASALGRGEKTFEFNGKTYPVKMKKHPGIKPVNEEEPEEKEEEKEEKK